MTVALKRSKRRKRVNGVPVHICRRTPAGWLPLCSNDPWMDYECLDWVDEQLCSHCMKRIGIKP